MRKLACGRPAPKGHKNKWENSFKDLLREKLQVHLRRQALNQSESRNQILEIILEQPSHFSVNELLKRVQTVNKSIGTATVYRSIPIFLESGILRETLTDEQGSKVYEILEDDHHDHIVCLDCGEIFEFHDEAIEKAQEKLSHTLKFKPVHHKHVMYAHCQQLAKAK
jgi:Fur family transcriptional regulator, ferric uptake regulator